MKKLFLVTLGLLAVLGLGILWKNSGNDVTKMFQLPLLEKMGTPSASTQAITTTPTHLTEILITITDNGFVPQVLTISAPTKITWINKSLQVANVSSNPHPVHTDYSPLNLGNVNPEGSVSLTFDKPGRYGYHNHLIPSQTGTIVVQ